MPFLSLWSWVRGMEGKAESKLPALLTIVVLGGGGFIGWQYFAPYWNSRIMVDSVKNSGVLDAFVKKRPNIDLIAQEVEKKLADLGIPFNPDSKNEHLEVRQVDNLSFYIDLRYRQVIQVPGFEPNTRYYEITFDGQEIVHDEMIDAGTPSDPIKLDEDEEDD